MRIAILRTVSDKVDTQSSTSVGTALLFLYSFQRLEGFGTAQAAEV